ncbi:MAG: hypothetical protein QMC77_08980 [Methanocellales archaeon]|nr:hypothetical protein [Methanocellales archaeon]
MEKIDDLTLMEEEVFKKVKMLILNIKKAIEDETLDLTVGIDILEVLRKDIYEDLNQIQHEAMILQAAQSINSNDFYGDNIDWYWNPRQTGLAEEPDLRGKIAGKIVVSAEITTSENPVGTIDTRMASTLKNLDKMPGKKIYFVRTETMEKRAKTKVSKCGYQIEIRKV